MKWKKLGKIFDPVEHRLPNDCREFAQSPQAIVFDDFVRIYFSTRQKEASGKFLSHIAFVDFEKDMQRIRAVSTQTVIPLGGLGCFDEHGIFPISPLRVGDKIYAYTCGWSRRVSVSVDTSTGLAISNDNGLTFEKQGTGPVFSSSLNEPFLVGDSFVQLHNDTFHMWYIYGTSWATYENETAPDRVYKIAYATSRDGINWQRDGKCIIPDSIGADECQALPTVIQTGSVYHMFFCYRHASGFRKDPSRGYRLGYAWSRDMKHWTRDDAAAGIDVTPGDWDADMMCYPHLFSCDGKIYLLYNGNEFGRYGFGLAVLEDPEK